MAEERVLFDRAVAVDRGPRISHCTIAGIDAHEGAAGRLELDAATDIEREHGVATLLARQRRWKDRNTGKRLRCFREPDKAGPKLRERSDRADAGADRDAEQALDAARTECRLVGEISAVRTAGVERDRRAVAIGADINRPEPP